MKIRNLLIIFGIIIHTTSCASPAMPGENPSDTIDIPQTAPNQADDITYVTSILNDGPGSLREALENAKSGDTIIFDSIIFPPDSPATIAISSELPHIRVNNLTIDASNAGVILDGSNMPGEWTAGLQIVSSEENTIMGLQISYFPGPGIAVSGAARNNVIGGDRSIGAGPFGQGNFLSNNVIGVDLSTNGTTINSITGNLIGTDVTTSEGLGNFRYGVLFSEGAHHNIIGPDNIIAFNDHCGVGADDFYSRDNTVIQNNYHNNGDDGLCLLEQDSTQPVEACSNCSEESLVDLQGGIIFHNGHILTMDKSNSFAEAIAVKEGMIVAVGSNQNVLMLENQGYQLIDLQGRTIMPAFIDTHTHVFNNNDWDYEANQDLVLSYGIGTVGAMSLTRDEIDAFQKLSDEVGMKLRANIYMTHITNCGEVLDEWYTEFPPSRDKSDMLRIAGVKIFTDGGSCNAPARSIPPNGDLYFSQEVVNETLVNINQQGYQAAIHALGDRAVEQVLFAIQNATQQNPIDMRNRIEHTAMVRDDMLGLHDQSGAVAIIFGDFPACYFGGDPNRFGSRTPEEYIHWEWRWRELIDANPNTVFAWHSDYKAFDMRPFVNLYGFVVRKETAKDGSICEPPDWAAANRISVEEALRIMTINSAYALFMEDVIGSLEPGKFADMIIISDNPLTVDHEALDDIAVYMTMVNGKSVYCASGFAEYCP